MKSTLLFYFFELKEKQDMNFVFKEVKTTSMKAAGI